MREHVDLTFWTLGFHGIFHASSMGYMSSNMRVNPIIRRSRLQQGERVREDIATARAGIQKKKRRRKRKKQEASKQE